jgi:uncharacterized protein YndB with AHSA1/START domain
LSQAPLVPIVAETTINAPAAQVWDVLISSKTVPQWLGCLDYRSEPGATFFMQQDPELKARGDTSGATHCTIQLMEAPNKFVFTWFEPGTPETIVEFHVFAEGANQTTVRLIHDGWDQFPADAVRPFYDQLGEGWRRDVLPGLKRLAEKA